MMCISKANSHSNVNLKGNRREKHLQLNEGNLNIKLI